jgi:hypothetical protein
MTHEVRQRVQGYLSQQGWSITTKESHQHRVPNTVLRTMADRLVHEYDQLMLIQHFNEILEYISVRRIRGFGTLSSYDAALRIGFMLRIYPAAIYVHAGVYEGLRRLGVTVQGETVALPDIEAIYGATALTPYQCENFICHQRKSFV